MGEPAQRKQRFSLFAGVTLKTFLMTQPQSALIPVVRITLPHFYISSAMSLPKSAGESRVW
jgi:hypothetical protein